jgi:hypothetical protein
MRSRGSRRSRGRGAGTAAGPALVRMSGSLELLTQPTARKEYLAATEVWSSDAALSPDDSTRAVRGHPSRVPAVPVHRVLRHCCGLPSCLGDEWRHHRRLPRAYHCARMRVEICVLPRTRLRSIGALSRREAASCPRVRPVSSTSGTARPRSPLCLRLVVELSVHAARARWLPHVAAR